MPVASGVQRVLVKGVPVWRDAARNLYYYDGSGEVGAATRIQIGTEASGFFEDWATRLETELADFRARQTARTRAKA